MKRRHPGSRNRSDPPCGLFPVGRHRLLGFGWYDYHGFPSVEPNQIAAGEIPSRPSFRLRSPVPTAIHTPRRLRLYRFGAFWSARACCRFPRCKLVCAALPEGGPPPALVSLAKRCMFCGEKYRPGIFRADYSTTGGYHALFPSRGNFE